MVVGVVGAVCAAMRSSRCVSANTDRCNSSSAASVTETTLGASPGVASRSSADETTGTPFCAADAAASESMPRNCGAARDARKGKRVRQRLQRVEAAAAGRMSGLQRAGAVIGANPCG